MPQNSGKKNRFFSSPILLSDTAILGYLACSKLLLHLSCVTRYGFFRDEFYYIACGEHLDFGYVDHPPFIALVAAFTRWLLGDSLLALRLPAILTGALIVFFTGILVREMGGKRFAQVLAALAVIVAPVNLFVHHILSMNVFDHLFWVIAAWLTVKVLKQPQRKYWILLGITCGLGLQNKISMLFFIFGLGVGLLLTEHRKLLLTAGPWLSGLLAFLIFLPHLLWQVIYNIPTFEFMHNAQVYKNAVISPLQFLGEMITEMHPLVFPIFLLGLIYSFFSHRKKLLRPLGLLFLAVLLFLLVQRGKVYYLAAALPLVLAMGSIALEELIARSGWRWLRPALLSLIILGGAITAPVVFPILPVEAYLKYMEALPLQVQAGEQHEMGPLPQPFADMFGWEEMVAKVAEVYHSLPPEEQARCSIFMGNYGEAGAIDFLGRKYGLPHALSGHNSYFLWGYGNATGEINIELNDDEDFEALQEEYESVERRGTVYHPYAMPYENNLTIFLCRKLKRPIAEVWQSTKIYI